MKGPSLRIAAVALGGLLAIASVGLAGEQPYVGLANQLVGHYDGVAGPANKLRVIVQPARPFIDEQRLTVTVQGTYNGNNVSFDGVLSVQPQGETARLIWATRRSDCQVDIHPEGDGFAGLTLPGLMPDRFSEPHLRKVGIPDGARLLPLEERRHRRDPPLPQGQEGQHEVTLPLPPGEGRGEGAPGATC